MPLKKIDAIEIDLNTLELKSIKESGTREILPYFKELILQLQQISMDVATLEVKEDKKALNRVIQQLIGHEQSTRLVKDKLKALRIYTK